jgi:hypothetical protein
MSTHDHGPHDDDMPDSLRWSLRGLRRDTMPENDLWPAIAARLAVTAQQASTPASSPARPRTIPFYRRPLLLATAASLVVALGIGWQLRPAATTAGATADPTRQLVAREAAAMTIEYDAALRELQAGRRPLAGQPALNELDRSAAQIRTALARDPDAHFLLERLHSLYSQRLALTQRLAALS